ncbi:hypothetical protein AOLI_G00027650 [Acnodon oligacanthus]
MSSCSDGRLFSSVSVSQQLSDFSSITREGRAHGEAMSPCVDALDGWSLCLQHCPGLWLSSQEKLRAVLPGAELLSGSQQRCQTQPPSSTGQQR